MSKYCTVWIKRNRTYSEITLRTSVDSKYPYAWQCLKCVKQAWKINTVCYNFTIKKYYSIKQEMKPFATAAVFVVASQNPSWKWSPRMISCKFVPLILLNIRLLSPHKCCIKNQFYDYMIYGTFLALTAQISKRLEQDFKLAVRGEGVGHTTE